jgi:hypothetical protein
MPDPVHVEPCAGHHAAALCDDAAAELTELATELDDEAQRLLLWHAANLNDFGTRFRSVDAAYGEADRGGGDRYPS